MFQKKYTFAEITEVLLKLRDNKGVMYKTSKEVGVSVDTIKRWREMYAKEVWNNNPVTVTVNDQLKERLTDENAAVRQKAKEVAEKALEKMLTMMDSKRISMKDLIEAFKVIGPYLLPKFEDGGKDSGKLSIENNYATFIQKMYTNLNKDGTKTIRIQGNQTKLPGGQ